MDKAMMAALRADQSILEAMTGEEQPIFFFDEYGNEVCPRLNDFSPPVGPIVGPANPEKTNSLKTNESPGRIGADEKHHE